MFCIEQTVNIALTYYVFYNIWDVVPLALIMHYHHTCFEAQQAAQEGERDPAGTLGSILSTQPLTDSPYTTRPTETTETTNKDTLIDSVYEQRMADIEARDNEETTRNTDTPQIQVYEDSTDEVEFQRPKETRSTSEPPEVGDNYFASNTNLNESVEYEMNN